MRQFDWEETCRWCFKHHIAAAINRNLTVFIIHCYFSCVIVLINRICITFYPRLHNRFIKLSISCNRYIICTALSGCTFHKFNLKFKIESLLVICQSKGMSKLIFTISLRLNLTIHQHSKRCICRISSHCELNLWCQWINKNFIVSYILIEYTVRSKELLITVIRISISYFQFS